MEIVAIALVLVAIYAVKAVAMMRWQDDEIAKSTSFSWTKPGMQAEGAVKPVAAPQAQPARTGAWAPSTAVAHLRSNRWAMPIAR